MKNRRYEVGLNGAGLDELIQALDEYPKWLERKMQELCEKLAQKGLWYAEWNFSGVEWTYSGEVDYELSVEKTGENQYAVIAQGQGVLFLEFGAGYLLGYGHPEAKANGMGPGTYPNAKGHWNDRHGWWYREESGLKVHTYGNAPGMPMYGAVKDLRKELKAVIQEVFSGD